MVFAIVLVFLAVALLGIVIISVMRKRKKQPERRVYSGAIRTTDHEGNDVLIVRKDDGSFEMVRESKAE